MTVQAMARYPALPVLSDQLSRNAVILMDDAIRKDERRIADLWSESSASLRKEYVDLEKGAYVFRSSHEHALPMKDRAAA